MVRVRYLCPSCRGSVSPNTFRRHQKYGCPSHRKHASKLRRAAEAALARLRRLGLIGRHSESPPRRPSPHFNRRYPPRSPPPLALRHHLRPPTPPIVHPPAGSPDRPNFDIDTPGAGPGPSSQAQSPRFAQHNPNGPNLPGDEDDEDNEDELDVLDALPWLNGLTAREYYAQDVQRELLHEGLQLPEYHRLTVQAFNYKVDTDITGRAYNKLRRAFPDRLGDLPKDPSLQTQINKISAFSAISIHCCINSCIAYTGVYEQLESCPWCGQARYKASRKHPDQRIPRRTFQYLPLIPRLINLYRDTDMARRLRYRSGRQPIIGSITDIFDGTHYLQLLREFVCIGNSVLGHRFFSNPTDIALGLSTDGVGPFKTRKQQCWPLILINYNLPPSIRTRLENILCLGVIPGPQSPKELNTFLEPLIDELDKLARGVSAFNSADGHPFVLHAYLIAAFGDMPAVAKLMNMKGPNGKLPCRACNIRGVLPGTGSTTNYVPLSRPFNNDPHGCRRYDPLNLPLRTHAEYLEQALDVEEAINDADEGRRSQRTGINGLSPLARVPSLSFPCSFPHNFMHLIFENIIPTLLDLWTRSGSYEKFGSGDEEYLLHPDSWTTIVAACALAGDTIPYVFGCRVPDLKKKRGEVTAEARLLFATLLGPILLRGRFVNDRYYKHFICLVRLINLCIDFGVTHDDVDEIRNGFAGWVKDYERYYYNNDPHCLPACTLPLHALLHVADDIKAMGPVWAYWAFPMERFCGALTRASKSCQFPYSSINRRVLQLAQLSQIKLIYGLTKELDLDERCENIKSGTRYDEYPELVFVNPSKELVLQPLLRTKISKYVSHKAQVDECTVSNALQDRHMKVWGKMQRLDGSLAEEAVGGDVICGAMLLFGNETMRDASHVRFYSKLSRWRWDRVRPTELQDDILSYGRAELFVVLEADFFETLQAPNPHRIVVAIVSAFPKLRYHRDADLVEYALTSGNYASAEVVDADNVDCLIGRVATEHRGTFIVERTSVVGRMDMLDITVDPN